MNLKVEKNGYNPFHKSKYATLDDVLELVKPILTEQGIVCTNDMRREGIVTTLHNVDKDDALTSFFPIEASEDPQKIGKAITYGKRYNLSALLNIQTEDDNDGNQPVKKETKRFNEPEFKNFMKAIEDWKKVTLQDIKKKYSINKEMQAKVEDFITNFS